MKNAQRKTAQDVKGVSLLRVASLIVVDIVMEKMHCEYPTLLRLKILVLIVFCGGTLALPEVIKVGKLNLFFFFLRWFNYS